MDIKEMRELPLAQLRSEAQKLEAKIWTMRFQAKGEPLENSGSFGEMKKERARLLTLLREKELGGDDTSAEPVQSGQAEDGEAPAAAEETEDTVADEAEEAGSEGSAEEPGES
jgi:large subunit ribosomal protein L29